MPWGESQGDTVGQLIESIPEADGYMNMRVDAVNTLLDDMTARSGAPLSPIVWSGIPDGGVDGDAIADRCDTLTAWIECSNKTAFTKPWGTVGQKPKTEFIVASVAINRIN